MSVETILEKEEIILPRKINAEKLEDVIKYMSRYTFQGVIFYSIVRRKDSTLVHGELQKKLVKNKIEVTGSIWSFHPYTLANFTAYSTESGLFDRLEITPPKETTSYTNDSASVKFSLTCRELEKAIKEYLK